jgi:hypothetical protein
MVRVIAQSGFGWQEEEFALPLESFLEAVRRANGSRPSKEEME